MTQEINMTFEEVLEALANASQERGEEQRGFTRAEVEERLGWPRSKTLRHLKKLITDGTVQAVYLTRYNDWGEPQKVKGYDLTR